MSNVAWLAFLVPVPYALFPVPCSLLFALDEGAGAYSYSRAMAQVVRYSVDAHGTGFLWISFSFAFCLLPY